MTQNKLIPAASNVQSGTHKPSLMTILDGGMGRELERRGAPFRQPEWSALALSLAPDIVRATHLDYIKAGATVITVNSYAVTPFHLGDKFFSEGEQLIAVAAKLAFEAVKESREIDSKAPGNTSPTQIAGCLPPLFGSYQPDLFDPKRAPDIAWPFLEAQKNYVDIWLMETQSSIIEAKTWHQLITEFTDTQNSVANKPIWIAFTLDDSQFDTAADNAIEPDSMVNMPTLRSGESITEAVHAMMALHVDAILFNCSQPEVMNSALTTAKAIIDKAGQAQKTPQLGVYANAFAPKQVHKKANTQLRGMREDTAPEHYLNWATLWQQSGATIIGGCCGIGVEHIALLAEHIIDKP